MSQFVGVLAAIVLSLSVNAQNFLKESTVPEKVEGLSGAETLIRLQKYITTDEQRLNLLKDINTQLKQEAHGLTQKLNKLDSEHEQPTDSSEIKLSKRREYLRKILDYHLQIWHAVQQQITVIESKIKIQKEVVNFITHGQIPTTDDVVPLTTLENDTINYQKKNPKIQHRRIIEAAEELEKFQAELALAKHSLQLAEQLMRLNREDLELVRIIADASLHQLSLYEEQITEHDNPIIRKMGLIKTSKEMAKDTTVIAALEERLQYLEVVFIPVVNAVNDAEKNVDASRERLEFLQSPLAPHQIFYWIRYNLPRIAIIMAFLLIIWALIRWVTNMILSRLKRRRLAEEHLERIETLKLASSSIISIIIIFIGFLILMSELGVDLKVVLGGAAVFSLIIAFGAQSLIKDYFSGFMILLENQYRVGNVVKINKTSGLVENMSLRLTILRDIEGIAHFIPHGQITEVSNLTHGWSQVSFDIKVSYKENVDHVIEVLNQLACDLKEDPEYGKLIHDKPDMLGVDAFAESAVVIKFLIKTRPLKQWLVKRELLRRIKNRFDELGIEIPVPHLSVYHRNYRPGKDNLNYND